MGNKVKYAIIGGRDFSNYELVKDTLKDLTITEIISGGAKGADSLGAKFAEDNDIKLTIFYAEWNNFSEPCKIKLNRYGAEYNVLAGFNRNTKIIEHSDIVIAFWDGKSNGTKDSLNKAKKLGKEIIIVSY